MSFIIALGGGSGSGKSFLANAISSSLPDEVTILSYDAYYKDQSNLPFEVRAALNYDDPAIFDEDLFLSHLHELKKGRSIEVPQYDFSLHQRKKETLRLDPKPFILVEGIMVYTIRHPEKEYDYRVYVDVESDIRLCRRILRDEIQRGRTPQSVIKQYLATVRPMHKKYIEPTRGAADFIFDNSSLNGIDKAQLDALIRQILIKAGKKD